MNNEYFTKNAVGIAIVHLRSIYKNGIIMTSNTTMDYHLHMLTYYNRVSKTGGVICLDTDDLQTFPCEDNNSLRDMSRQMYMHLTKVFIDKVGQMSRLNLIDEKSLFISSDDDLWIIFNSIKQETFIEGLKSNKNFIPSIQNSELRNPLTEEYMKSYDDTYGWANIRLAEERIINDPFQ